MAKRIFLILLSTFITTSWCRNGRYTLFKAKEGLLSYNDMKEAFETAESAAKGDKEQWTAWKWPTLNDIDDLYQIENILTATGHADGTKAKKIPFGCFLDAKEGRKAVDETNKKILAEKGKGAFPWILKPEFTFTKERSVPFLVNDPTLKYKLIYVKPGDKLNTLKGLENVKIYPFRHTLFANDDKYPSNPTAGYARFSPLSMMSFNGIQPLWNALETKDKAEKEKKGKKFTKWQWPDLQTVANLYYLENVLSGTAHADGFKKTGLPYGCFLKPDAALKGDVVAVLGERRNKPTDEIVVLKDKNGNRIPLTFEEGTRTVPFFINYGDQKWKVMYVNADKDVTSIPGLTGMKVYVFRHTLIPAPKKAAAYFQDVGDLYYDDGYYQNGHYDYYYDQDGYYEDEYDQYGYDDDSYYHYNAGSGYGRNGLYRLMRAYRNGLFQN